MISGKDAACGGAQTVLDTEKAAGTKVLEGSNYATETGMCTTNPKYTRKGDGLVFSFIEKNRNN